ncbi:sugar ABC transporter ATP-binding protein [Prosthecomicrobium pneumaticum]|uniref:ABC-type sugar transport system ATPase subunit n=1 Tax=Prosthecomicrobium pneumaticum TaxID=81895 RepID=A0A7W9FL51_9HYPH|nr:sugar ABC transporter ATP-binding protein [Prosthecomicrobium pneumaticum]MBB5752189.1 ABC-type sugar transport system ATPase subunit [Prosthecomicrobium pneumaticum]
MAAETDAPFVVEALSIVKRFGGATALAGVDFRVRRGEIHALLGQNGAGKSTLVKILNGVHRAGSFEGRILLDGRPVSFGSTAQARLGGVGYVPQEIEVLEQLSVAENVFAGQTGLGGRLVRQRVLERQASVLFRELGLDIAPSTLVAALTPAQRHIVMIARALAAKPAVLMLDEPTASLSGAEVDRLFILLRRLKAQGTTMIFITHRLPEVMALCDRATVLRDGRVAAELKRGEFDAGTVIAAMSGQRLSRLYPAHTPPAQSPVLLEIDGLSVAGRGHEQRALEGIDLTLRAGEILGIAGLLGSGRSELLGAIYGSVPYSGRIRVEGRAVTIRRPKDARDAAIALLTEDRKRSGLLFNLPVAKNITIGNLMLFSSGGVLNPGAERAAALRTMRDLRVKAPSPNAAVAHLSGGNQQKLLLGRVLMRQPKILLLDEPTKGVDVGTRSEIYRLIVDLAETGVGLIVVSSELEEVIGLADRCLVMADGRFVDAFERGAGSEERVLRSIAAAQAERAA